MKPQRDYLFLRERDCGVDDLDALAAAEFAPAADFRFCRTNRILSCETINGLVERHPYLGSWSCSRVCIARGVILVALGSTALLSRSRLDILRAAPSGDGRVGSSRAATTSSSTATTTAAHPAAPAVLASSASSRVRGSLLRRVLLLDQRDEGGAPSANLDRRSRLDEPVEAEAGPLENLALDDLVHVFLTQTVSRKSADEPAVLLVAVRLGSRRDLVRDGHLLKWVAVLADRLLE